MSTLSNKTTHIGVFALIMLISGAIDSIRNLPATALFGNQLIFFFIFSAIFFLIPAGLVSAELSSTRTQEGGVYSWVRHAFGEKIGLLAIWLQWINTMVWYPTILSFIAGTLVYFINPHLAENREYLVAVILITFWTMTIVNLKGVKTSAKFASVCGVIGLIIPMALIITLAVIWLVMGKPLQLHLTPSNIIPQFSHSQSWISLTAIMTAFLGMELATVHVNQVHNPQKTFPQALFYSVIIILLTMILGSLAIAIVVPNSQINLVNGVMQTFVSFFNAYHIPWMIPVITTMILIGSIGNLVNWIISPAKGLLQAAQQDFLPRFFRKENKHGVASNLLIIQAVLVSLLCSAFLLMPSVNGSYWLLTALSTQLYMLMYVLMFLAGMVIRSKLSNEAQGFKIPGGKWAFYAVSLLGLIGCATTFTVGFFPPQAINVGSALHYEIIFSSGIVVMIVPVVLFYAYKKFYGKPLLFPALDPFNHDRVQEK